MRHVVIKLGPCTRRVKFTPFIFEINKSHETTSSRVERPGVSWSTVHTTAAVLRGRNIKHYIQSRYWPQHTLHSRSCSHASVILAEWRNILAMTTLNAVRGISISHPDFSQVQLQFIVTHKISIGRR